MRVYQLYNFHDLTVNSIQFQGIEAVRRYEIARHTGVGDTKTKSVVILFSSLLRIIIPSVVIIRLLQCLAGIPVPQPWERPSNIKAID